MTDETKVPPPMHPDRLLTLIECVTLFGLTPHTWGDAIDKGEVPASSSGGRGGRRIRAEDAHAFVVRWHEKHRRTPKPTSTEDPT